MRLSLLLLGVLACASAPKTIGEECDEVIDAICDRDVECGLIATSADCIRDQVKSDCCTKSGVCNAPPSNVGSAGQCANGVRSDPCTKLANKEVPGVCATAVDVMGAFNP